MTGVGTALTQFMSLLVDGIETLALGIANGVTVMAKAIITPGHLTNSYSHKESQRLNIFQYHYI